MNLWRFLKNQFWAQLKNCQKWPPSGVVWFSWTSRAQRPHHTTLQTAPVLRVTARLSPRTHRVSSSSSCRVTVTRWTAGWWYSDLEFIKWSALEFTMLTPSFTCLSKLFLNAAWLLTLKLSGSPAFSGWNSCRCFTKALSLLESFLATAARCCEVRNIKYQMIAFYHNYHSIPLQI